MRLGLQNSKEFKGKDTDDYDGGDYQYGNDNVVD